MRIARLGLVAVIFALVLASAACSSDGDDAGSEEETTSTTAEPSADDSPGTVVDVAVGDEDFSTLVTALESAGLVETLSDETGGPFTVFAPTNAAFDALPDGTLDALLEDPDGALTDVLLLHVAGGEIDSTTVAAAAADSGCFVAGLDGDGGSLQVAEVDGSFTVAGATITTADIEASNGVVHVIDAVITEPSPDCPS